MKLRRLQRQDEEKNWYDDAYVTEDKNGTLLFHYNLTWDRVGSTYNQKLQESTISLDQIQTIFQLGENFRWLPVETIPDNKAEAFLTQLNQECAIPTPQRIMPTSAVATR